MSYQFLPLAQPLEKILLIVLDGEVGLVINKKIKKELAPPMNKYSIVVSLDMQLDLQESQKLTQMKRKWEIGGKNPNLMRHAT